MALSLQQYIIIIKFIIQSIDCIKFNALTFQINFSWKCEISLSISPHFIENILSRTEIKNLTTFVLKTAFIYTFSFLFSFGNPFLMFDHQRNLICWNLISFLHNCKYLRSFLDNKIMCVTQLYNFFLIKNCFDPVLMD